MRQRRPFVNLLGVKLTPITVDELNRYVGDIVSDHAKEIVNCINVHKVNLALKDSRVRDFLNDTNVVFADGAGVILGARLLGQHVPERLQYGDWLWSLAEFCQRQGCSFYFLGAKPGIAEKAAAVLRNRFPTLRILGTDHGYFNKAPGHPETEAVIERINAVKPDILIVGLGRPAQELWLRENWRRIEAKVGLTGGGAFDLISGSLPRGPRWAVDNGFEWLCRLFIEPRRLWRRYLLGNPLFLWRVFLQATRLRSYTISGSTRFFQKP